MPELSDEIWSIITAAIVALIVGFVAAYFATRKSEARLREEYQSEITPERMARMMMLARRGRTVAFRVFEAHMGGLSGDELRRVLIGAGALRFSGSGGAEEWGLLSRNKGRIGKAEAMPRLETDSPEPDPLPEKQETPQPEPHKSVPRERTQDTDDFDVDDIEDEDDYVEVKPKPRRKRRSTRLDLVEDDFSPDFIGDFEERPRRK